MIEIFARQLMGHHTRALKRMPYRIRPSNQRGVILIEWMLGALLIMTLAALSIESMHWHTTRHIAQIALLEAARAASREQLYPKPIQHAFLSAMRARFAGKNAPQRMQHAFTHVKARSGLPAWQIERLSPNQADFLKGDVVKAGVPAGARGKRILRHDRTERDGQRRWLNSDLNDRGLYSDKLSSRGFSDRKVPSGILNSRARYRLAPPAGVASTLRSNAPITLHLRLTYLHAPLFPVLARILTIIRPDDPALEPAYRAGLIVIRIEQRIEMHSDAIDWGDESISYAT